MRLNYSGLGLNKVVLAAILLLAFFVRVQNLHYNSPFVDEALYIVLGNDIWAGTGADSNPFSWVGGLPWFYPPLTALFYTFGIAGSRFFNVLLGTAAVYFMYLFAKLLGLAKTERDNQIVGLAAALFLALLTIPIYLSRLANYDMLSFTLFLAGLVALQSVFAGQVPRLLTAKKALLIAALLLFLSFLAKYVTLSLFPFILLWAYYQARRRGGQERPVPISYLALPLIGMTAAYILWNFSDLMSFASGQIPDQEATAIDILASWWRYAFLPIICAAACFVWPALNNKATVVALGAAALIIPATHMVSRNAAAINQHVFLSLIFLLPIAGYLFLHLLKRGRIVGLVSTAAAAVLTAVISYQQLQGLQSEWPNSDKVMEYLRNNMSAEEVLLTFEDDVSVLALPQIARDNIIGNFYFEYQDSADLPAYQQALADGYFDWVLFNESNDDEVTEAVREKLPNQFREVFRDEQLVVYQQR